MSRIGIGVVGLGFIGRRHALNAAHLQRDGAPCELVAVCSPSVRTIENLRCSGGTGNLAPDEGDASPNDCMPELEPTFGELLANEAVDLVVIATPTPHHVTMSIAALQAGKHVLVEKPVALHASDVERLRDAASIHASLHCMPAHVMRFWPGWTDMARWIRDEAHGSVRSATFQRLGARPTWNDAFYADIERSGGALVDLHVHDVDFLLHCFGTPASVHATGNELHVTGSFTFDSGPSHVTAEAAWDRQPGAGFRMRCTVEFERAGAEYDSASDPPLTLYEGDEATPVASSRGDGFRAELEALIHAITDGSPCPVTLDDALRAARVIDEERGTLHRS